MTDLASGAALSARYRNQIRHAEALVRTIDEAVRSGSPADAALHAHFRDNRQYGGRDRRLLSGLAFAWFRWKGWVAAPDATPDTRAIALAAGLEGGVAPEMMTALCESAGLPPPPGELDGAALDQKAGLFAAWTGATEPARAADLVPGALLELLDPAIPAPAFLVSIQSRPPVWLRLRSARAEGEVNAALIEAGLEPLPHSAIGSALRVQPSPRLQEVLKKFPTALQVQSLASQAVGQICAPQPRDSWWDACCGSGGKTLHLLDQAGPTGRILASDVRGPVFEEFAKRVGPDMSGVKTRVHDLAKGTVAGGAFDGVLVDAPCSGMGTWARNPDARWRLLPAHVEMQSQRQAVLLANAARSVRPGGRLVYSVCTLSAAETTAVADGFDRAHPGFEPLDFVHPLQERACPGRAWIAPHDSMGDGMFIAAWKRIA